MSKYNPRSSNGAARRAIRDRWRAIGAPCALCHRPINYDLGYITDLVTGKRRMHPMAFVVDEIIPVSRYREGGFDSPEQAALTWSNTQPAHYICNARKGNMMKSDMRGKRSGGALHKPLPQPFDEW